MSNPPITELGRLYAELVRVTPRGHLPFVTLRQGAAAPFEAVVVNAGGELVTQQCAKSIDGLVQIIERCFSAPGSARASA
jgi:hypothetical protein